MHVISQKKFRDFWKLYPRAEKPLRALLRVIEHADWEGFSDVRQVYATASLYHRCVVFNVGGNKFRVVAAIHYNTGKVYVRHVLTHEEYDKDEWKKECCGS